LLSYLYPLRTLHGTPTFGGVHDSQRSLLVTSTLLPPHVTATLELSGQGLSRWTSPGSTVAVTLQLPTARVLLSQAAETRNPPFARSCEKLAGSDGGQTGNSSM
jgi:hypothetical protein